MNNNLIIYTSESCVYCRKLKAYLDSKGVSYTELDVKNNQSNANELLNLTGQTAIPVTVYNESEYIIGFNKEKINEILKL